jgi:hypothetical protein
MEFAGKFHRPFALEDSARKEFRNKCVRKMYSRIGVEVSAEIKLPA